MKLLSLEAARANAPKLKYDDLPKPEFTGVRVLSSEVTVRAQMRRQTFGATPGTQPAACYRVSLEDLVPFIDWTPFFHTWELRGVYPKILQHEKHGEEATKLFADAQKLLEKFVVQEIAPTARVYGLFPANRVGDDVEALHGRIARGILTTFHFLRQQIDKGDGTPNWCLADFVAPKPRTSNIEPPTSNDYIGAFAVTSGHGLKELVEKFKADHDDYNAIMAEAMADRLAEAFAEFLHKRVRDEWGFGKLEKLTTEDLIARKISRHPPGGGLSRLSRPHGKGNSLGHCSTWKRHAGIKLTESFAMWPGS